MKNKLTLACVSAVMLISTAHAQSTSLGNTAAAGRFLGWNTSFAMDLDIENRNNNPIHFRTNSFERMLIFNGSNASTDGRVAIGNNLPSGFTPQDRLHLHESATTGATAIHFSNATTTAAATRGYVIGITNSTGSVFHSQLEQQPIQFWMPQTVNPLLFQEWMRLQHGNATSIYTAGTATNGYLGLNESAPFFHLEQKTPAYSGGELFVGAHPADVSSSRMGMINGTPTDNFFRPTLFGKLDATQPDPALQTLAAIDPSQDLATNSAAQRFLVSTNWDYNNGNIQNLTAIRNRPAFSWQNASNVKMWMSADGRVRIGNNLNTSTAQVTRLELTADPSDILGSQIGSNGASGLRFTNLTSSKIPYSSNPGPGVLSVDANGDVIYVPAASGGGGVTLCPTIPLNNVTKNIGSNTICQTNITDLYPANGVGINATAPNDALDVNAGVNGNGNIDVDNPTSAYKMGDIPILWHKGVTTNLYVGIMAGDNVPLLGGGNDNTVVGQKAAAQNTNLGNSNTVLGSEAAYTLLGGQASTYIGYKAGYNAGPGNNNTFVGSEAGANGNPGADENVLIGWRAGYNISGLHNVCVGNNSGANNSGYQNTFIGIGSGATSSGQNNVAVGGNAIMGVPSINFASAIGAGSIAMVSNTMILGDNTVNVGIGLSGNSTGPANKLEINTTTGSPYFGSVNGSSGLKFRNMTTANTPLSTVFNGVLSVDATGNVILVQDKTGGSGSALGNYCGNTPNTLLGDYEIPTGGFDFHFSADNAYSDKVNIGIPCNTPQFPGKLNVTTAFPSDPYNLGNSFTVYATNTNGGSATTNAGVYGSADNFAVSGAGNGNERGVWGFASGENDARGVFGQGGRSMKSYGGYFEALNPSSTTNYGVFAEARSATTANYGIYATVGGTSYGGFGPDWAGYFDGDVFTTTGYYPSDKNLKKNIQTVESSLSIINQLNPVSYNFDWEANKTINLPASKQYGFISQEVAVILPELTKTAVYPARYDANGKEIAPKKEVLALNYNGFIAILAKGIQEQQEQIEKQNESIKQQQQQIDELKALVKSLINPADPSQGLNNSGNNAEPVLLSDKNAIVLNQNVPNPFAESTVITYNIPASFSKAQIIFSTAGGVIIKIHEITTKGKGQINVFADDLSSGIYKYSLVVDGKTIESKSMIKN